MNGFSGRVAGGQGDYFCGSLIEYFFLTYSASSVSSLINWLRDCGFPPVSRGGVEGFGALKLLCLHCSATAAHSAC